MPVYATEISSQPWSPSSKLNALCAGPRVCRYHGHWLVGTRDLFPNLESRIHSRDATVALPIQSKSLAISTAISTSRLRLHATGSSRTGWHQTQLESSSSPRVGWLLLRISRRGERPASQFRARLPARGQHTHPPTLHFQSRPTARDTSREDVRRRRRKPARPRGHREASPGQARQIRHANASRRERRRQRRRRARRRRETRRRRDARIHRHRPPRGA